MAIKKVIRFDARIVGTMDDGDGSFRDITYSRQTRPSHDLWAIVAQCDERMEREYKQMCRLYWRAKSTA